MPQLAAQIKAKYPGAYDDIKDEELEKLWMAKHPDGGEFKQPDNVIKSAIDWGMTVPEPVRKFSKSVGDAIDSDSSSGFDYFRGPKAFLAGALTGTKDQSWQGASGFLNPLDVGATVTGMGAVKAGARGLNYANKLRRTSQALSAPVALHGGVNVVHPDSTMAERVQGAVEVVGGTLGMHFPKSAITPKPWGLEYFPNPNKPSAPVGPAAASAKRLTPGRNPDPTYTTNPRGGTSAGYQPPTRSTEVPLRRPDQLPRFMAPQRGGATDLGAGAGNLNPIYTRQGVVDQSSQRQIGRSPERRLLGPGTGLVDESGRSLGGYSPELDAVPQKYNAGDTIGQPSVRPLQTTFAGWQPGFGSTPDYPTYNLNAPGHPSTGSSFDAGQLKEMGFDVPKAPPNPNPTNPTPANPYPVRRPNRPFEPLDEWGFDPRAPHGSDPQPGDFLNSEIRPRNEPEVLPPADELDMFGIPTNRDLTDLEVETIKKRLNQQLKDSYGEDTVEGQRAVDQMDGIVEGELAGKIKRLESDNPPIIDDAGGLDFVPEADQSMGGLYTGKSRPELEDFLRDVQQEVSGTTRKSTPAEEVGELDNMFKPAAPARASMFRRLIDDETGSMKVGRFDPKGGQPGVKFSRNNTDPRWVEAETDAKILGIDTNKFEFIEDLEWEITKKTYQETARTGKNPLHKIEGPEASRVSKGGQKGAKVNVNVERAAEELITGYNAPREKIMVRETIANAKDAIEGLGDAGNIRIELTDKGFEINDNGVGMRRNQLMTVMTNLHETGKANQAGATGGKGIGKAPYLLGGTHTSLETVANYRGNQKVKMTMAGTPDEIMKFVPIEYKLVPPETPTGTKIVVKFKANQFKFRAESMLDHILEFSRDVNGTLNGTKFKSRANDEMIESTNLSGNDIDILIPENTNRVDTQSFDVHYLNNGLYQYTTPHYLSEVTSDMPENLIIDIRPTAKEGATEYPFPSQRESVKSDLQTAINDLIDRRIANPRQAAKKSRLQDLYDGMTNFPSAGTTTRSAMFFDPGSRLLPDELLEFQTNPITDALVSKLDSVIDGILTSTGRPDWGSRLEGVGLVLDDSIYGIHIPNPMTDKSSILMNPFLHILNTIDSSDAALDIVVTSLHEVAHVGRTPGRFASFTDAEINDPRIGKYLQHYLVQVMEHGGSSAGHGMDFVHRLGEVFSTYGVKKTLGAADEIEALIGDGTGGYNSEVQRLLHLYTESRGRAETTEDLLTATGIKQKAGRGGKGDAPGGNKPDGKRTANPNITYPDLGKPPKAKPGDVQGTLDRLFHSMSEAKGLLSEREAAIRTEKARRFANFEAVKEEGIEGAARGLNEMKGKYTDSVDVDALQMDTEEIGTLFTAVKHANITSGEKLRGYTALFHFLNGQGLPARSDLAVLDTVFGGGFSSRIVEMHGGLGAVGIKLGKVANTAKAMMSTTDLSAPLRQGIGMIHKKEWRQNLGEMLKFFGDKEYFDAAMTEITRRPNYILGREAGLFIADQKALIQAEEAFLNNYVGSVPILRDIVGASERAYTGFLNKVRADVFDNLIKDARTAGHEPFSVIAGKDGKPIIQTSEVTDNIAKFINNATGRGNLGRFEKLAPELNMVLWSPRLLASRLTVLNPKYYMNLDKFTQREALKSLLAITVAGITMGQLATAAGADVLGAEIPGPLGWFTGRNPKILSSDFGKGRFANDKVIDPWAGFQQPIVAAARFITGRNEVREQNRAVTAGRFLQSKLSPAASFAWELATAKDFTGQGNFTNQYGDKTSVYQETAKRFVPIFTQDLIQLLTEEPDLFPGINEIMQGNVKPENLPFAVPPFFGAGIQDYPERSTIRTPGIRKMSVN